MKVEDILNYVKNLKFFILKKKIKERHNKYVINWNLTNNQIHMEGDKHS
jgi:hypothetical protein